MIDCIDPLRFKLLCFGMSQELPLPSYNQAKGIGKLEKMNQYT